MPARLLARCARASAIFLCLSASAPAATAAGSDSKLHDYRKETIVVYNSNVRVSRDLALFYAKERQIPSDNVVGLDCPEKESINRKEYEKFIEAPLRAAFTKNKWWVSEGGMVTKQNKHVIAVMYGVPLRILQVQLDSKKMVNKQATTTASVDSELMQLGVPAGNLKGSAPNPYFGKEEQFHAAKLPGYFLVGRIDAPTPKIAKQMIIDAMETEKTGLWGYAYIDLSKKYPQGDQWLLNAAAGLRGFGFPVILDHAGYLFPANYPAKDPAVYYGWYAARPGAMPGRGRFQFRKGAIACHIFSYSATSLRAPKTAWTPLLLERGAAVALGNVSEPFLHLTTHLDRFNANLLKGYTVAEAYHAATPGLSWMTIMCGDPLYRPFKFQNEMDPNSVPSGDDIEYKTFRLAIKRWINGDPKVLVDNLDKAGARFRSFMIYEGLGLLAGASKNEKLAAAVFAKAESFTKKDPDKTRIRLHAIDMAYQATKDKKQAQLALDTLQGDLRDGVMKAVVRAYLNRINPAPPKSPKKPKKK